MANAINTDSTISLSVAMLIKVGFLIMVVTGSWYQAQMQFAEHQRKIEDLQNKVTVLSASVEGMESQHIQKLEEENKKENAPMLNLDGKEYDIDSMTDDQKVMVNHIADLNRKIDTTTFNLQQLQFGRQAFIDGLKVALAKETNEEEVSES